jgi:hypothetical protein
MNEPKYIQYPVKREGIASDRLMEGGYRAELSLETIQ